MNTPPLAILAYQYKREVEKVSDVIDLLFFNACGYDRTKLPANICQMIDLYTNLFKERILKWIKGIGHPNIPSVRDATVAEDDFQKECANPLLRAKALLKAVTEFSTLPPTNQCISVSRV